MLDPLRQVLLDPVCKMALEPWWAASQHFEWQPLSCQGFQFSVVTWRSKDPWFEACNFLLFLLLKAGLRLWAVFLSDGLQGIGC